MNIEILFDFLVRDYGLSYKHQHFINCYDGHWEVETYSFYNDSGCFTIYFEIQRGMEFWYSSQFSTDYQKLCQRAIDISLIEPDIWERHKKIMIFNNPFFWWDNKKVLNAFSEVLKVHLSKGNDFFGIQIKN